MSVLWERGPSTVGEVREALETPLAYTTVLTVLRILEAKGHVTHESEGKAYRYAPLVTRETAGDSALTRIVSRIFSGSKELLLAQLVQGDVSRDEIHRLRRLLDERVPEGSDK